MMLILVVLLAVNFARIGYNMNQYAECIINPKPVEAPATTAREQIVKGVCTFGDCPVATKAATTLPPETEPTTVSKTEMAEPVSDTYTLPEPVIENHNDGYIGMFWITGYTAEEGFPEGSETASGYGVRPGYCALNAEQRRSLGISYGDYIYVSGLGTYRVMDSGCGWGVVDIWVYTNAEAYRLTGYREVYIA